MLSLKPPDSLVESPAKDRLAFERLISDTSARLMAAPMSGIPAAIDDALMETRLFFRADRCGLLTVSRDQQVCTVYRASYAEGVAQVSGSLNLVEVYPWAGPQLLVDQVPVAITRMADLPPEAAADLAHFTLLGTRSQLTVPVVIGSRVTHLIVIHSNSEEREWPAQIVARLRVLGELFASALQRNEAFEALQASEARLMRAAAAGDCGLWEFDTARGRIWMTPERRRLYGLADAEAVTYEGWVGTVHHEDRDRVLAELQAVVAREGQFDTEYRAVTASGRVRWMHATGRNEGGLLVGASVDITERVLADQAARQEAGRVAAAIDAAELAFADAAPDGTDVYADARLIDLLGLVPGDEQQMPDVWLNRIDDTHREQVRRLGQQLQSGDINDCHTEHRYQHPTRGWIWIRHATRRVEDPYRGPRLITAAQDVTEDRTREDALRAALEQVKQLRDRLERENVYLRTEVEKDPGGEFVAGRSPAIRRVLDFAGQVAVTNATVLLVGETGTGKERFASYIHQASPRRSHHMVRVNCSAIPSALIESELFGRERGAYTGALSKQIGRFELAHKSTLFLDEIGDLPMEVQVKLLRALEERTIERLGSPTPVPVDVRIIAATNRNLEAEVRAGTFRSDLYYRLNVFPIVLPPLRDRREDIPTLVETLVEELSGIMRKRFDAVDRDSLEALRHYDWPGNVRELRNVLERAMILSPGPVLTVTPPHTASAPPSLAPRLAPAPVDQPAPAGGGLREVEREHIVRVLEETGWRIRGRNAAAEVLGLKPTTLEARMARLGIQRPSTHQDA